MLQHLLDGAPKLRVPYHHNRTGGLHNRTEDDEYANECPGHLLTSIYVQSRSFPYLLIFVQSEPSAFSDLWKAIFEKLQVNLLYSTAYHPQTDGSSERTNQTAEIALRFYLHNLLKPSAWLSILPRLKTLLNNSQSSKTTKAPNKISYGFTLNKLLDLLNSSSLPVQAQTRIEAADAISFAQMHQNFHYDRRHQPMYFRVGRQGLATTT